MDGNTKTVRAALGAGEEREASNALLPGQSDAQGASLQQCFGAVFSTRRPKHAVAGVSSGVKSAIRGAFAGVGSLFALPAAGASSGAGFGGFAQGCALGIASAIAFPVAGCGVAIFQSIRGLYETPTCVFSQLVKNERWEDRTRRWVRDDLQREGTDLPPDDEDILAPARERQNSADPSADGTRNTSSGEPVDRELYDRLGVEPDASAPTIKKQYYKLAKESHPDKNPHDDAAKERFQKLGEAYQILSDDESRRKYDKGGKENLEGEPSIDPGAFFTALFGSQAFEHLVGKPHLATMAEAGVNLPEEETTRLQMRRESRLAVKLSHMLQGFTEDDGSLSFSAERKQDDAFEKAMRDHAQQLASCSFGPALLHTIGFMYKNQAMQWLSNPLTGAGSWRKLGIPSTAAAFQERVHGARTRMKAAGAAMNVMRRFRQDQAEGHEGFTEQDMPGFVEALFCAVALDIESTLKVVVAKVLRDASATERERIRRAKAIKRVGEIFLEAIPPSGSGDDVEEAVRNAFLAATGAGQEEDEQAERGARE